MKPTRDTPFGAHNFQVDFEGNEDAASALGGFSDVSGLGGEIALLNYQNHRIAPMVTSEDGRIDSLAPWMARHGIVLTDEYRRRLLREKLTSGMSNRAFRRRVVLLTKSQ